MADVVRRLRSLSRYCDQLAGDLLDPGMRKQLYQAARYFEQQADVLEEAKERTILASPRAHSRAVNARERNAQADLRKKGSPDKVGSSGPHTEGGTGALEVSRSGARGPDLGHSGLLSK